MKSIAIHEAGHVVIAKSFGYSCTLMKIDKLTGDAFTKFNWRDDELIINTFLHPNQFGSIYNGLSNNKRAETPLIAGRYIMILCAGSCAEAYFNNKDDVDNKRITALPIEMGAGDPLLRTDIDKIERTESSLKALGSDIPIGDRQEQLITMFYMVQKKEIFEAIDALSETLVGSKALEINEKDIDECLNNFDLSI